MKRAFKECNFRAASLALIEQCNEIIEDYADQGLTLTLRQLYYQLVTKNVIPNRERSYKNLSNLVTDARLAGLIDWAAIEDRGRQARYNFSEFKDLNELVDTALRSYRLPRWEGQKNYAELWVEKDALAGVLSPLGAEFHVPLMVNRGYSSASAMYESSKRFIRSRANAVLFYLGDHDPSGEDMVRDIRDRLEMFGASVDVQKIALTMDQVREYNPPPNPAKMTDPRATNYVAEHGASSWEVDALPPNVLTQLVRDAFKEVTDQKLMDKVIVREDVDKERLRAALENLE